MNTIELESAITEHGEDSDEVKAIQESIDQFEEEGKKFDYSYVKELREEAKKYRTDKAKLKTDFAKKEAELKKIEESLSSFAFNYSATACSLSISAFVLPNLVANSAMIASKYVKATCSKAVPSGVSTAVSSSSISLTGSRLLRPINLIVISPIRPITVLG